MKKNKMKGGVRKERDQKESTAMYECKHKHRNSNRAEIIIFIIVYTVSSEKIIEHRQQT